MFNIKEYLQKFHTITSSEGDVRNVVTDVLQKQYNITIPRESITYHNKHIFIKTHPLIKNEISVKKHEIQKRIQAQLSCTVVDIH